ncbi:hypothetical protein NDA15_006533 [Ustilago hordei]|nr:hypothetical protein NDA15_006533 [Ustilago hordei]
MLDFWLLSRESLNISPRKRVAKTHLWTDRDQKDHEIQEALSAFQTGQFKDLKAATEHHNVPYNTLWDHSKGCKSHTAAFQHLQAIQPEAEELLVQHIQKQVSWDQMDAQEELESYEETMCSNHGLGKKRFLTKLSEIGRTKGSMTELVGIGRSEVLLQNPSGSVVPCSYNRTHGNWLEDVSLTDPAIRGQQTRDGPPPDEAGALYDNETWCKEVGTNIRSKMKGG